jgi:lysine 6-dehydrogenase
MRFIVLGGAGVMGQEAVRFLAAYPGVSEVMVADQNLNAAQAVAQELGGPTRACQVDALDHEKLVETIRGYDVALGFIGPFLSFERRQAQAAVEAGVHYVSIADDYEAAREVLALDEAARAAGVTIITGLGSGPGISNLLAMKGTNAMDRPRRIHIAWFSGVDQASGKANFRHSIHIFSGKVPSFENGREVMVRAGGGKEMVDFPPPCGRVPAYYVGHAEPVTLPRYIPGLETLTLKGGVWPAWQGRALILMERVGLFRSERSQKFWADLMCRVLPKLPSGKFTVSGFRVDVHGEKDGRPAHYWYTEVGPMVPATGIPAALGALMLAEGKISQRGVFPPEAVIDPDPFFASLEPYGLKAESHEG